jgi:hypothetical protein
VRGEAVEDPLIKVDLEWTSEEEHVAVRYDDPDQGILRNARALALLSFLVIHLLVWTLRSFQEGTTPKHS